MYSEEIKATLAQRIGFGTSNEDGFTIEIDEANSVGTSGLFFSSFHALVTVDNIYAAIPDLEGSGANEKFNDILQGYRTAAVLLVLPMILDASKGYDAATDYDTVIEQNIGLFDRAVGVKCAIMILEMMLSSKESNLAERNVKLSAANLKLEINGFKNDSGHLVAAGLLQDFGNAIKDAKNKLFPIRATVQKGPNW